MRRTQKLQCLRIDNLRSLPGAQFGFIDKTEQVAGSHAAIDPARNRRGDLQPLGQRDLLCQRCFERHIDPLDCCIKSALVEQMHCFKIPSQPFHYRVPVVQGASLLEQIVGLGELAQIGFLQCAVDQIFGRVDILSLHPGRPLLQCFKKGGRFRVIAAQIAPVAFCQRLVRLERRRLHPREGEGVLDRCRGDVNRAVRDAVLQNGPEGEQRCAVVGGQPFRHIGDAVLLSDNHRIGNRFFPELTRGVTKAGDGRLRFRRPAGHRFRAMGTDPPEQVLHRRPGCINKADGPCGVAANHRPAAVEHIVLGLVLDAAVLDLAQDTVAVADWKTVAQRRRGSGQGRCRNGRQCHRR